MYRTSLKQIGSSRFQDQTLHHFFRQDPTTISCPWCLSVIGSSLCLNTSDGHLKKRGELPKLRLVFIFPCRMVAWVVPHQNTRVSHVYIHRLYIWRIKHFSVAHHWSQNSQASTTEPLGSHFSPVQRLVTVCFAGLSSFEGIILRFSANKKWHRHTSCYFHHVSLLLRIPFNCRATVAYPTGLACRPHHLSAPTGRAEVSLVSTHRVVACIVFLNVRNL